jgi:nucleoside-diphosphate-sugar epimerase
MSEKPTISILGCGWLGYPLALELVCEGYTIKGSSRSEKRLQLMRLKGISSFYISFEPLGIGARMNEFFISDVLIIAIPPATSSNPSFYHPNQIMNIRDKMERYKTGACIFISSTVAYPNINGIVNEETAVVSENNRAFAIVYAEKILQESSVPTSIIRCGGLMGYDRKPIKYLSYLMHEQVKSGKTRKSADTPVNYVHRDDVIGIIKHVLDKKSWGQLFNAVAPEHPSRREILLKMFPDAIIIDTPEFDKSFKIVDGNKINLVLDYNYRHPNPLYFPSDNE